MKKFLILLCSAIFIMSITTCVDEGMEFDTNDGKGLAFTHFVGSAISIATELEAVEEHTVTITVSSTVKSDQARTYTLSADASSTAIEGTHYNLSSKTITIPAGQFSGSVTLTVVIDNLISDVLRAVLTIDDADVISYGGIMTVSMNRVDLCEFDESMLVGTFNYASEDWMEWGTVSLAADPDDPFTIYINGIPTEDLDWNETPIILHIDPVDYSISGPKAIVAEDAWGYGAIGFEALEGSFDICSGTYILILDITLDSLGSVGDYEFIFSK